MGTSDASLDASIDASAAVLDVQGLTVDLPVAGGSLHAVRGVDLRVGRGETLCLVGESGSGKSMTALSLMALLPARATRQARRLALLGQDLLAADEAHMRELRGHRVAMVFQEPMTALNPAWTIGEQLVEGLLRHVPGTPRAEATARAVQLLQTCGVGEAARRLGQYPHQLSGGLRQRVMIAMALMTGPELLIADEPTTALDATIQAQILDLLRSLQREFSLALLLVTHNFEVVRRIADRVAVMYAGEVVESGPVDAVLQSPAHPYTRALLACAPSALHGGRLASLPGTVPTLVGALSGCQFRNRCRWAEAACAAEVPQRQRADGHVYRCVRAPDAPDAAASADEAHPAATAAAPAEASSVDALAAHDLHAHYPVPLGPLRRKARLHALRGVSLRLPKGASLGIVGESGSGKSTLARMLLGLESPSGGTVSLFGRAVGDYARAERALRVQPVFQDPYGSLNPRRSVAATVRLPLDIHGIGQPSERDALVRRMLAQCGLPERLAGALPAQLSGGQRQRVAIASALVMRPGLLVCDEPTSALDVSVQAQIVNLLNDLRAELGLSLVVISHDLGVIRRLSERIAVMYLGSVVEQRRTDALFAAPAHPYTELLLSAAAPAGRSDTPGAEFPDPLAPPPGCAFHPRCPHASERCRREAPPLRALPDGEVACHHPRIPIHG